MRLAGPRRRLTLVLLLLVAVHFWLRPRLPDPRFAPDLVYVALLVFAIRVRPMGGAVAGFLVGIVTDALAPSAFGASALALTIVGYVAGWLKAFAFADNVLITGLFVFATAWFRDVVVALAGRQLEGAALAWQLLALAPAAALTTAVAAAVTLLVFRGWLRPRSA